MTLKNILVSQPGPQWRVKVADFGIARVMDGTNFGTRNIGTYGYMAPELRDQSTRCTPAVDVFALGAVTFCMRTRRAPSERQLIDYQRDQEQFTGRALGACSGPLMAFVMAMMADLPEQRLTIGQVLAHEWLVSRTSGTARYVKRLPPNTLAPPKRSRGADDSVVRMSGQGQRRQQLVPCRSTSSLPTPGQTHSAANHPQPPGPCSQRLFPSAPLFQTQGHQKRA